MRLRTQKEPLKIRQVGIAQFELESFGRKSMVTSEREMLQEVLFFFTGKSEIYPGTSRYGKVEIISDC